MKHCETCHRELVQQWSGQNPAGTCWRAVIGQCSNNGMDWREFAMAKVAEVDSLRGRASSYSRIDADVNAALNRAGIHCAITFAEAIDQLRGERDRLRALINTPRTDDFFAAVRNEAAHQIERWGSEHDAGKRPEDWIALLVYLVGKATKAHCDGDEAKLKHHVVTVAAVCLNWLRNLNGETTAMRPGIGRQ